MSLKSIESPIGTLTWEGRLTEETEIQLPDGRKVPFYTLISHTNGACIDWVQPYSR